MAKNTPQKTKLDQFDADKAFKEFVTFLDQQSTMHYLNATLKLYLDDLEPSRWASALLLALIYIESESPETHIIERLSELLQNHIDAQ